MNFAPRILGNTNLKVGPLGIASSYGAPARAYEEAFEKGCNYFVWNSFMKGRSKEMLKAMRNIIHAGMRDRLIIAVHSYGHNSLLNSYYVKKSLKLLGTDHIDVMLLGYYSWKPSPRVLQGAKRLKEKGLVSHIGMTGHNRGMIGKMINENLLEVYHVRYNAVHSGAEKDIFPFVSEKHNPGIVAFTATSWRQLMDPKKMPPGEAPLTAADCYRFALSDEHIHVCLTGPKTLEHLQENLKAIELGPLSSGEMERVRRIGEYIYKGKGKQK
ncbi:MAG: aldo/keto reductase [Bacteroidales bacterium]|nr:aldo/keto reductase [Bacteroidales bacterium]